jgi:hypothetical protein
VVLSQGAAEPPTPRPTLGLPASATSETPDDTELVSATPSPRFAHDHTIVALGSGQSCGCPVLLRSTDGGATWAAAAASPPYGRAVVLPPGYPADARIFVTNVATGGVPDFVAPAFGRPFVPLPLPPGDMAFSAAYQAGDPRLFVAGATAVWSLDAVGRIAPLLAYPNANQAATLATPTGDPAAAAVLVVAPRGSATPAALVPTQAVTLFSCSTAPACTAVSSLPHPNPSTLVVSPAFVHDHTLLFVAPDGVDVSSDGGRSLRPVALPRGAGQPSSAALVPSLSGGTVTLWTALQRAGSSVVVRSPLGDAQWVNVTDDPVLRRPGFVVPVAADRLLVVAPGFGFRCTVDDGASWKDRCPAV